MSYDFSEKTSYSLIDEGQYEMRIENADFKQSKNGKKYIGLTFKIRDDVNQDFTNRLIWDNIWENEVYRDSNGKRIKKDDYDKLQPNQRRSVTISYEYNDYKIRTLIQAQNADEYITNADGSKSENPNYKTKFNDIEEVVQFLNGIELSVKVTKYTDANSGEERNSIDYKNIKRTKNPSNSDTNSSEINGSDLISDDDLPF